MRYAIFQLSTIFATSSVIAGYGLDIFDINFISMQLFWSNWLDFLTLNGTDDFSNSQFLLIWRSIFSFVFNFEFFLRICLALHSIYYIRLIISITKIS